MNEHNTHTVLIEAQQVIPSGEELAMTVRLQRHDTLFLIGPDTERLCCYMRTLAGVEAPHSGELTLFDRPLTSLDKQSWREQRQQIGYVARNAPILSVLRGLDNVMLPALYHKRLTPLEAKARALELIAETGCRGDIHKLPAYLSEQQRLQLAIARATILDPAVLFLEQPFFRLSLAEQQPIYDYVVNNTAGRALALATHNLRLVKAAATQILFIGEKQLQLFSSWNEMLHSEAHEIAHYLHRYQQQYQAVNTDG